MQFIDEWLVPTLEPMLPAEVIAGNPSPGMLTVTINRGSSDGIAEDMAVI